MRVALVLVILIWPEFVVVPLPPVAGFHMRGCKPLVNALAEETTLTGPELVTEKFCASTSMALFDTLVPVAVLVSEMEPSLVTVARLLAALAATATVSRPLLARAGLAVVIVRLAPLAFVKLALLKLLAFRYPMLANALPPTAGGW
ncbi:hypothetical protein D3C72_1222030 [compost metagenome]